MPNFSKATLLRIARQIQTEETADSPPLAKLATFGAFGRKAMYNWTLPETDPQHRAMPPIAKRMVAMLAYLSGAGLLNDKRMDEILALQQSFETGTEGAVALRRLNRRTARVKGVRRAGAKPAAAAAATAATEAEPTPPRVAA